MSFEFNPIFIRNLSESDMANGKEHQSYQFQSFRLDTAERLLLKNGEKIALTPKAFDVLVHLVERNGHLVEKDELMQEIWPDSFVEEGNLTRIIHTIRKALGENQENRFIETIPKTGYRFIGWNNELPIADLIPFPTKLTAIDGRINGNSTLADASDMTRSVPLVEAKDSSGSKIALRWGFASVALVGSLIGGLFLFSFAEVRSGSSPTFEKMSQTRLTQSGDVYGPAISPNGQYIVYTKLVGRERGLFLRQIATGQTLELVAPQPDLSFWYCGFSRDSNFVYYTEHREGDHGILYRIPSLGGEPKKIVESVSGTSLSPDGTHQAIVRTNRETHTKSIVILDTEGNNERPIHSIDSDSLYQGLDWSPDGKKIAYVVKKREGGNNFWYVAEISVDGLTERVISGPRSSKIITAYWMPDGKGFVMNAFNPDSRQAQLSYLSYPNGVERRLTNDLNYYFGFSMTADGKTIVVQQMEQDREIWIQSEDGNAKQVTFKTEQHYESVGWLSDDTLIFDVDENGTFRDHNILQLRIGESEPRSLTSGSKGGNTYPVVSPDRRSMAFVSTRSGSPQIWQSNVDGGEAKQITNFGYSIYFPQYAPDRRAIYFKSWFDGKGHVMRVPIDGGEPVSLSVSDIVYWAISPDGKKLAYSSLDPQTNKIVTRIRPIDEDRTEMVCDINPATYLRWSGDGKGLYFTTTDDDTKNIWHQSLLGGKPRRVTNFDRDKIFLFTPSPNGKDLAIIRFLTRFDAVLLKFDN